MEASRLRPAGSSVARRHGPLQGLQYLPIGIANAPILLPHPAQPTSTYVNISALEIITLPNPA
jgi:hypothetical protein